MFPVSRYRPKPRARSVVFDDGLFSSPRSRHLNTCFSTPLWVVGDCRVLGCLRPARFSQSERYPALLPGRKRAPLLGLIVVRVDDGWRRGSVRG